MVECNDCSLQICAIEPAEHHGSRKLVDVVPGFLGLVSFAAGWPPAVTHTWNAAILHIQNKTPGNKSNMPHANARTQT